MKRLRAWFSYFTVYPLQILAAVFDLACAWSIRLLTVLRTGSMTHAYIPLMRARRWVGGAPGYTPEDTVFLGIQPRTPADQDLLRAWAVANHRDLGESDDGSLFLWPACEGIAADVETGVDLTGEVSFLERELKGEMSSEKAAGHLDDLANDVRAAGGDMLWRICQTCGCRIAFDSVCTRCAPGPRVA